MLRVFKVPLNRQWKRLLPNKQSRENKMLSTSNSTTSNPNSLSNS